MEALPRTTLGTHEWTFHKSQNLELKWYGDIFYDLQAWSCTVVIAILQHPFCGGKWTDPYSKMERFHYENSTEGLSVSFVFLSESGKSKYTKHVTFIVWWIIAG